MNEVRKAKKKRSSTKYPKYSLLKSLEIAKAINDNNAGNPFNRLSLAEALGLSPSSSKFRMLITASSKYGLTKGSYNAKAISLTPLAISILKPKTEYEKISGLKASLYNVEFYKKIFTKYNNHQIPKKQLFKNILEREYEIPQAVTEQCYNLIMENAKDLGVLQKLRGNLYINLSLIESQEATEEDITESIEGEIKDTGEEITESAAKEEFIIKREISKIEVKEELKPKAFIAHSKNKKILRQIKDVLEFGQFDYVIAEDVETTAIPIPEKIFGLMRECNCAIINISADEQEKMPDDSYKINENVLIEIGASFLKYDKKVILLVDKRIELPSNLQGVYRCEYEGDELTWDTGVKLQKALQDFRN